MSPDTDFSTYVAEKETTASPDRHAQMGAAREAAHRLHDEHFADLEQEQPTPSLH